MLRVRPTSAATNTGRDSENPGDQMGKCQRLCVVSQRIKTCADRNQARSPVADAA
jgi:hypothetical protein